MTHDKQKAKGSLRTDQDELMFAQGFSFSGYERDPLFLNLRDGQRVVGRPLRPAADHGGVGVRSEAGRRDPQA